MDAGARTDGKAIERPELPATVKLQDGARTLGCRRKSFGPCSPDWASRFYDRPSAASAFVETTWSFLPEDRRTRRLSINPKAKRHEHHATGRGETVARDPIPSITATTRPLSEIVARASTSLPRDADNAHARYSAWPVRVARSASERDLGAAPCNRGRLMMMTTIPIDDERMRRLIREAVYQAIVETVLDELLRRQADEQKERIASMSTIPLSAREGYMQNISARGRTASVDRDATTQLDALIESAFDNAAVTITDDEDQGKRRRAPAGHGRRLGEPCKRSRARSTGGT